MKYIVVFALQFAVGGLSIWARHNYPSLGWEFGWMGGIFAGAVGQSIYSKWPR